MPANLCVDFNMKVQIQTYFFDSYYANMFYQGIPAVDLSGYVSMKFEILPLFSVTS